MASPGGQEPKEPTMYDTAIGQPSVTNEYHSQVSSDTLTLREVQKAGGRISRVRLLGEAGYRDISYIHAEIDADCPTCSGRPGYSGCGTCLSTGRFTKTVRVDLRHCPSTTLIPANRVKATFIDWAKAEGVFAKGLGLLDSGNWSTLL